MQQTDTQTTAAPGLAAEVALTITRILAGAYFLAAAAALQIVESGPTLMAGLIGATPAQALTAALLFVTSVALLLARHVRPAAIALAAYVVLTGLARFGDGTTFDVIIADGLLITALLLIAVAEPRFTPQANRARRSMSDNAA